MYVKGVFTFHYSYSLLNCVKHKATHILDLHKTNLVTCWTATSS